MPEPDLPDGVPRVLPQKEKRYARAHAAADGRDIANVLDIRAVAPMALRQRRSQFMVSFFTSQREEDDQIRSYVDELA